jgi:cullin 3
MCILLLFNKQNTYTFKDIQTSTAIPILDLKRNLTALACGKSKILLKEPNTKTVEESDTFTFNDKFRSRLFKVKVLGLTQKETDKERKTTQDRIDEDRKYMCVSTSRKKMNENESENEFFFQFICYFVIFDIDIDCYVMLDFFLLGSTLRLCAL